MSTTKRYAVVSCHVERLLDDGVWPRYRSLVESRPGGFRVASLVRPPDPEAGESESVWLERARALSALGPFGHHTHWTSPTHARPTEGDTGARVRSEAAWLAEQGLEPVLFAGGGWYTDASVAAACVELGYADCTPRASRPSYLRAGEAWAELAAPARVELPGGGSLLALPTTHSIGDVLRRGWRGGPFLHAYFHDTDLLDWRRRLAVRAALRLLAARREQDDLSGLAEGPSPERVVSWGDVARGEPAVRPE